MILVWGPSDDPPAARVSAALRENGADVLQLDERALPSLRYDIITLATPSGWLETAGRRFDVTQLSGIYLRPWETQPAAAQACLALAAIAASTPARAINRPAAGRSNWSKPYQLQLIAAAGLAVPETLVTTDPLAARAFLNDQQRVAYKSISGIRSVVSSLVPADAERLQQVAHGPVQFQRWIEGTDVRVHVVGQRWFASAVRCDADDYRYGSRRGAEIDVVPTDIPDALGRRLVTLSQNMGLLVSGVDLRVTADGEWYCFEVNPSPGFTFYEDATGQPIARAIAELLMQRNEGAQRSGAD